MFFGAITDKSDPRSFLAQSYVYSTVIESAEKPPLMKFDISLFIFIFPLKVATLLFEDGLFFIASSPGLHYIFDPIHIQFVSLIMEYSNRHPHFLYYLSIY